LSKNPPSEQTSRPVLHLLEKYATTAKPSFLPTIIVYTKRFPLKEMESVWKIVQKRIEADERIAGVTFRYPKAIESGSSTWVRIRVDQYVKKSYAEIVASEGGKRQEKSKRGSKNTKGSTSDKE